LGTTGFRKVQENPGSLTLNGIHQFLVYTDDVNLMNKNINAIEKNTGSIRSSKEIGWSTSKHRENRVYIDILSPECRTKP
jgi:hypothetical protein